MSEEMHYEKNTEESFIRSLTEIKKEIFAEYGYLSKKI